MTSRYDSMIYGRTNLEGYFFDAILKTDHKLEAELTSHPVETGADTTDHVHLKPVELTFEIGMSDAMPSRSSGQFADSWSRSRSAWDVLEKLYRERLPLTALTRLGRWDNLIIVSLQAPDDYKTLYGLKATVKMRQFLAAQVKIVKVSTKLQVTGSTNLGTVQPQKVGETLLFKMFGGG